MVAVGLVFAIITAGGGGLAILYRLLSHDALFQDAWKQFLHLPLDILGSGLLGCLFGLLVGVLGKNVIGEKAAERYQLDFLGLIGLLVGCVLGGYLGFQDRDGFQVMFGYELSALASGTIVGTLAGGLAGAIVGEWLFPYQPAAGED